MLHKTIFCSTCLATLEKKSIASSRETCVTSKYKAATCNGFKKSPQSLQKVEPISTASVTVHGEKFFDNCVAMALQDKLQVGCSVQHALSAICLATFLRLAMIAQSSFDHSEYIKDQIEQMMHSPGV